MVEFASILALGQSVTKDKEMTKIVFSVNEGQLQSLQQGIGYEYEGRTLADLCRDHERELLLIPPSVHLSAHRNSILLSGAIQVVMEFVQPPVHETDESYGLRLAQSLTDLGIDVMLLVRGSRFTHSSVLNRIASEIPTVEVCDLNYLGRRVEEFIRIGNRFLLPDPYPELLRKQEEAHQSAMVALIGAQRRFAELGKHAQARAANGRR